MHLNREHSQWTLASGTRPNGIPELVSRSLAMRRIGEQIEHVGGVRLILIEGEAGTGKQLLARHIHGLRPSAGNLVIEEAGNLFESEEVSSSGLPSGTVEQASARAARGLLILRNIDELSASHQERLLHVIRSFETASALDNASPNTSPLQIICTARQPLRAKVLAGKYLPELYYRLSAVCLSLPPLRERKEDMPGLVQIFIEAFSRERRRPLQGLGQGSLATLLRHRWPGNVRELESVIRAACFATEGQWIRPIDLVILPLESVAPPAAGPTLPQDLSLEGVLRRHVQRVLKVCGGNKARAAARLGISRSTLYRMLEADTDTSLPVGMPNLVLEKRKTRDAANPVDEMSM